MCVISSVFTWTAASPATATRTTRWIQQPGSARPKVGNEWSMHLITSHWQHEGLRGFRAQCLTYDRNPGFDPRTFLLIFFICICRAIIHIIIFISAILPVKAGTTDEHLPSIQTSVDHCTQQTNKIRIPNTNSPILGFPSGKKTLNYNSMQILLGKMFS